MLNNRYQASEWKNIHHKKIQVFNHCHAVQILHNNHAVSPSNFWSVQLIRPLCIVLTDFVKVHPHYAAWQNATICSFAAWQKLLGICRQCNCVHMKKKFFADLLQVTKTVERDRWTLSDFSLKLADTILKPYATWLPLMGPTICRSNF